MNNHSIINLNSNLFQQYWYYSFSYWTTKDQQVSDILH